MSWLGVEKSALGSFWFPWTLMNILTLSVYLIGPSCINGENKSSIHRYADAVMIKGLRSIRACT